MVVQAFLICNGCAALLTVLLLLMRALLSRRISVRLRYYSWFALLFVLLLPLVPPDRLLPFPIRQQPVWRLHPPLKVLRLPSHCGWRISPSLAILCRQTG